MVITSSLSTVTAHPSPHNIDFSKPALHKHFPRYLLSSHLWFGLYLLLFNVALWSLTLGGSIAWCLRHWLLVWTVGFQSTLLCHLLATWLGPTLMDLTFLNHLNGNKNSALLCLVHIKCFFLIIPSLPTAAIVSLVYHLFPPSLGPSRFRVPLNPSIPDSLAQPIFPNSSLLCFLPSSQLLVGFRDFLKTYPNIYPPKTYN